MMKIFVVICDCFFFFLVYGNYFVWFNWGFCLVMCGFGVKKCMCICINLELEYGGFICKERDLGFNIEVMKCNLGECLSE